MILDCSILIFHAKVKPRSRITGSKYRKRSIFVFDKNRSFKTFTLRSGGNGCKSRAGGV